VIVSYNIIFIKPILSAIFCKALSQLKLKKVQHGNRLDKLWRNSWLTNSHGSVGGGAVKATHLAFGFGKQSSNRKEAHSPSLPLGSFGPGCPTRAPDSFTEIEGQNVTKGNIREHRVEWNTGSPAPPPASPVPSLTWTWCWWSSCPATGVWWTGSWLATPGGWKGPNPGLHTKVEHVSCQYVPHTPYEAI